MKLPLLSLAFALVAAAAHADESAPPRPVLADKFPVTLSGVTVNAARENPEGWDGKAAAVAGVVIEIRRTSRNGSLLELAVNSPTPAMISVISTVPPQEASGFVVGKELKVLGYLRATEAIRQSIGAEFAGNSPVTLQALCHQVQDTQLVIADPRLTAHCTDWAKGYLPQDLQPVRP
jgi:hypothetical protein